MCIARREHPTHPRTPSACLPPPQLACESDEGERRDALIHQLMKVTRGDPAGAIHFKPFAQWELHDGAASDDSVKTEALHSPSGKPALHAPSPPPGS